MSLPGEALSEKGETRVVFDAPRGRRVPAEYILGALVLSCTLSLYGVYAQAPKADPAPVVLALKTLVSFATSR